MAPSTIRITEPCATKRALLSRNSPTVLRFSRPETNDEVFELYGPEESAVELVKIVARMLPRSIEWEPTNEKFEFNRDTHCGSWLCDLKPIGRIANLGPERADTATERNTNGR